MSREDLYSTHADTIEAVISAVCRRHRLSADHAEELGSQIRLKIIEREYEVLRRFEGRSSLRTYLIAVSERVLLDWRVREWGKWRPCQEAQRLGPVAIELDRLLARDGLSFEEAAEHLLTRGVARSRQEVEAIHPKLAVRTRRWMVGDETLESMPAPGGAADSDLELAERQRRASHAGAALARALCTLPAEDQLILRLRFQDGFTVARIAALIGEEQKPLYRRYERLFAQLRERLSGAGVTEEELAGLLGHAAVELGPAFPALAVRNETPRPSIPATPGGRHA